MAKDWPKIIGPHKSVKDAEIFKLIQGYIDDIDDALTALAAWGTTSQAYIETGPRVFQPAAIKIGETDAADVLMQQPLILLVAGELITVAVEEIDISALTGATIAEVATGRKFRCLLTAAIADGTIDIVQGDDVADTEDAATPAAPEDTIGFGYIEITTVAATTVGTTALTAIATFKDLITPMP